MDYGHISKADIKRDLYIFIKNDLKSLREVNLLGKAMMLFYILTIRAKYE